MPEVQGHFHFAPFDLDKLLAEVRAECFPFMVGIVRCAYSTERGAVAWISVDPWPGVRGIIHVNPALDRPDTSEGAMRGILKHELLHIVVRPDLDEDGWLSWHPPAFWARQFELSPEFAPTCEWLKRTFGRAYRVVDGSVVLRGRRVRRGGWQPVARRRKGQAAE